MVHVSSTRSAGGSGRHRGPVGRGAVGFERAKQGPQSEILGCGVLPTGVPAQVPARC
jgi:hypothetical protein